MKYLIVGISVRAMLESAVGSGYRAIALDAFGDQDTRAMAEAYSLHHDFHASYSPGALLECSHGLRFDRIAYTANLENFPGILDLFSREHPIVGNAPKSVRQVRFWKLFFPNLADAGFQVPQTIVSPDGMKIDSQRRWLTKPLLSGGGHGVAYLRKAMDAGSGRMLQEYIAGKPCSACFVANGRDAVVLGLTEQLVGLRQFGSQEFRYCGNILPLPEMLDSQMSGPILEQINKLARHLTRTYNLLGLNGIDFILNGDQVYTIEVNPRYSASMELSERAYGLPMFDIHVKAVLEGKLPGFCLTSQMAKPAFYGKTILFADRDALAPDTRDWFTRNIRDIPAAGERLGKGKPICTLLTMQPTYNEAIADLIARSEILQKEIFK